MSAAGSYRSYRFGPAERRGVMLGLGVTQVLGLAGALGAALGLLLGAGSGLGALFALGAGLAWCFLRVGGRAPHAWLPAVTAQLTGGRRTLAPVVPNRLGGGGASSRPMQARKPLRAALPGLPTLVIDGLETGGAGVGVARVGRRASFTLGFSGPRFALADAVTQDRVVGDWAAVLASCATGRLRRLQVIERLVPDGGGAQARWLERAATPIGAGDAELRRQASAALGAVRHEVYLTAVLPAPGTGDAVASECDALLGTLDRFGFRAEPLSAERLAGLISDVVSASPCGRGVFETGSSARELAWERSWGEIRTADLLHASFEAIELPRVPVGPDWAWPLIEAADPGVRRTLSLHIELAPPQTGLRRAARAVLAHAGDAEVRARFGFRTGARQWAESAAATERESELASGFADARFALLVGVSVGRGADLEAACRSVQAAAAGAQVELSRLWGQQADALGALLPLGELRLLGVVLVLGVKAHRATTRHLASAYLAQAGTGVPQLGNPPLGRDAVSGRAFGFDPFALYGAEVVTNPNVLVLGQVGAGKSTIAKLLCCTQVDAGRRVAVLDPKGEYGVLAQRLGLARLRLEPGGTTRLNPLDATGPAGADSAGRRRSEMVAALAASALARELSPEERAGVDVAVEDAGAGSTLGRVVELLLEPTAAMAAELRTTGPSLGLACRETALGLRRLVAGDLAGMFDGATNVALDPDGPGVVVDLTAAYRNPAALGPIMVAAGTWLTETFAASRRQYLLLLDETWSVLGDPGVGRWLRSTMKLARALGVSVVLVTHTLGDFEAVGHEGSEAARLAASLVADTASRALLAQPDSAVAETAAALQLSGQEPEVIAGLPRGAALWHVGPYVALVHHRVPPGLADVVDTDAGMRGKSPEFTATEGSDAGNPRVRDDSRPTAGRG